MPDGLIAGVARGTQAAVDGFLPGLASDDGCCRWQRMMGQVQSLGLGSGVPDQDSGVFFV